MSTLFFFVVFSDDICACDSGGVELTNFPSPDGGPGSASADAQSLTIPNAHMQSKLGSVTTMDWSSDGYVLAVGWERGWAVWSVGGRCLAWSTEIVDDGVEESRYVVVIWYFGAHYEVVFFFAHEDVNQKELFWGLLGDVEKVLGDLLEYRNGDG